MFYDAFKTLCDAHGKRPYTLLRELGVKTPHVIEQWKKGSTPRQPLLGQIAEYFGVSIDYLLTGEEKQPTVSDGLSEKEHVLLSAFRLLSPERQDFVIEMLLNRAHNQEAQAGRG